MIKNNSSINFTSRDTFYKPSCKKETPKPETDNINQEQEEYTFESTARENKKNDACVGRNLLGGALLALGVLSSPIVLSSLENDEMYYTSGFQTEAVSQEDEDVISRAEEFAKFGKDSTVLEKNEFDGLLDYSSLEGLPKSIRESIKISSTSNFLPVNMNSHKSKEEILKQVKSSQGMMDYLADNYKKNPPKSSVELYAEYAKNNITDREILAQVDFSELEIYQQDLTVLKHLINSSREKIRRDEADAEEKEKKAVENAQKLVDGIVAKYKMKASVHGNYNGDDVLSAGEFAGLLNTQNLVGLPKSLAIRIIQKAIENYEPIETRYATDERQVEITNRKVDAEKEKAQQILDKWAYKAQKELFTILHPNEIRKTFTD